MAARGWWRRTAILDDEVKWNKFRLIHQGRVTIEGMRKRTFLHEYTYENIRESDHKVGSKDAAGEMKGSSLWYEVVVKGTRVSGPLLWFSLDCSSSSSRLGPHADVSRAIATPRPVNNTRLRLSAFTASQAVSIVYAQRRLLPSKHHL